MSLSIWIMAIGACALAAAAEGAFAGKGVKQALGAIRQPRWAAPLPVWIALGLIYYGLCLFGLLRLLEARATGPLALLLALMAANAVWNLIFFRARAFGWAFAYNLGYVVLFAAFWITAAKVDTAVAIAFSLYGLYQVYAVAWGWAIWRLNRGDQA